LLGLSHQTADTHGIVYTPQEVLDFMCASVAEILQRDFGLTLGSPGVLMTKLPVPVQGSRR
jgi:predicted helicase